MCKVVKKSNAKLIISIPKFMKYDFNVIDFTLLVTHKNPNKYYQNPNT